MSIWSSFHFALDPIAMGKVEQLQLAKARKQPLRLRRVMPSATEGLDEQRLLQDMTFAFDDVLFSKGEMLFFKTH
jgi:hypothetical protein